MGVKEMLGDDLRKFDKKYLGFEVNMLPDEDDLQDDEDDNEEVQVVPLFLESYYLDPIKFVSIKDFIEEYQYHEKIKVIVSN